MQRSISFTGRLASYVALTLLKVSKLRVPRRLSWALPSSWLESGIVCKVCLLAVTALWNIPLQPRFPPSIRCRMGSFLPRRRRRLGILFTESWRVRKSQIWCKLGKSLVEILEIGGKLLNLTRSEFLLWHWFKRFV